MNNSLMPALFAGHGNPMHAISKNTWSDAWQKIGATLPRPKAILAISAHWYVPQSAVTGNPEPPTIHDFGGFPEELYRVSYPAPGNPELARRVQELLAPLPVTFDDKRGFDHGTWTVLRHIYPAGDIPVIQLSIDSTRESAFHFETGKRLAQLRKEGVLIFGSGNVVHNLHAFAWGKQATPLDWAVRFERKVRELLISGNDKQLVEYETLGEDGLLSIPTPDHYLPLLYVIGSRNAGEPLTFPVEGIDGGSLSMLAVQVGES